jgi:hypothetical protein
MRQTISHGLQPAGRDATTYLPTSKTRSWLRNFTSNFTRVSGEGAGSPPQDTLDASLVPSANGIAFDADRNLWVAGWTRVLRFCFPITSGQPSSIVVGKPDFVTPDVNSGPNVVPPSQSLLWSASDVSFDQSGNMWVSDENDERILKYDAVKDPNFYPNLFHCGQPASVVLGHLDFTHRNLDQMHARDSTLFAPQAIAFDVESDLWVADNQYNRVLRFSHPFSIGQNATLVLGQSNFTSREIIIIEYTKPIWKLYYCFTRVI